jgi:hypothetical protein
MSIRMLPLTSPAAPSESSLPTLGEKRFNRFGAVTVANDEAGEWLALWPIYQVTDAEAK